MRLSSRLHTSKLQYDSSLQALAAKKPKWPGNWCWRRGSCLCGRTVCPGQDFRSEGADGTGSHRERKVDPRFQGLLFEPNKLYSLRRRFEQNQTDCTFTVLALLPTVTENVLEALPVEQLTHELQQKRAEKLARSGRETSSSDFGSSGPSSVTDGGDGASLSSFQSSSYVHASQMADSGSGDKSKPRRTKQELWAELKISCMDFNRAPYLPRHH